MKSPNIKQNKKLFYFAASLSLFTIVWISLSMYIQSEVILPSPLKTINKLWYILGTKNFYNIVLSTVSRCLFSFLIAFIISMILAFIAYFLTPVRELLKPFINFFRATPVMAFILIIIIWNREYTPLVVGIIISWPILYRNIFEGLTQVDFKLIEMAHIYRVPKQKIITKVYIPAIKSYLISASSTALGINFKALIAAEVLCQPTLGIGTAIQDASIYFETDTVFAWVIVIVVIAIIFDSVLDFIDKKLNKWRTISWSI